MALLSACGGGGGGGGGQVPVGPPPLVISTSVLSDGVNGQAYNATIQISGGTSPFTFSETTSPTDFFDDTTGDGVGACQGLTLDLTATGTTTTIMGTPVNTGDCGPFTIQVTDSGSPQRTATRSLTIRIADPLVITTATLANGTEGVAYNETVSATGGITPLSFSVVGSLPDGLALDSSMGDITGTPTMGGSFPFDVQVSDSSNPQQVVTQSFTVLILQITTTSLPDGVENQAYSSGVFGLDVTGQVDPVTWSASGLPASGNLTINSMTGEISGTPTAADVGAHMVTVSAADSDPAGPRTHSRTFTLNIAAQLVITTPALPNAQTTVAYNEMIDSTGGTGPFTWSEPTGSFDASGVGVPGTACEGLTLDLSATGASTTITGTPLNLGDCGPFTLRVDDSGTAMQFDEAMFTITVDPGPLTIITTTLPPATQNSPYNATIQSTGGTPPYAWSEPTAFFDSLGAGDPATALACEGLMLDLNATGASTTITGTPVTTGGCGPFTLQVDDSGTPADSDARALTITVTAVAPGRNDDIFSATPLSGCTPSCTISASISPYADPVDVADPDEDFYQLTATAGNTVTVEITAKRLVPSSPLDSVIEILDDLGNRIPMACEPAGPTDGLTGALDPTDGAFDDDCVNDDIDPGVIQDSKVEFLVPGTGTVTFFIRVLDWRGDARPDMVYTLTISNAD